MILLVVKTLLTIQLVSDHADALWNDRHSCAVESPTDELGESSIISVEQNSSDFRNFRTLAQRRLVCVKRDA